MIRRLSSGLGILLPVLQLSWGCSGSPAAQTPSPGTAPVTGRVLDSAGAPVAGATIAIGDARAQSGADGRFTVAAAPGGTQVARVSAPGRRTRAVPVAVADDGPALAVHLPPAGGIELVLTGDLALAGPALPDDEGGFADLIGPLAAVTRDADVVVANVEASFAGDAEPHPTRPDPLAAPGAAVGALRALGPTVVASLANEHGYDFLDEGLHRTLDALEAAKIAPLGAGRSEKEAYTALVVTAGGVRVGLAAFSALTGRPDEVGMPQPPFFDAVGARAGIARMRVDRVGAVVQDLRARADRVVVVLHGGRAYDLEPARDVQAAAHRAVDAGADLVVAHGPRIVQGVEAYAGKLVFYSLGNLARVEPERAGWGGVLLRVHLAASGPIEPPELVPVFTESLAGAAPAAGQLGRLVLGQVAERSAPLGATVLADGRVVAADAAALAGSDTQGTRQGAVIPSEGATLSFEDLLGPDRWLARLAVTAPADATLWFGRDLLGTGDMEDVLADGHFGPPTGLSAGTAARLSAGGAQGGRLVLSVCRSGSSTQTALARSSGRLPVGAAQAFSLCGCWRGDPGTTGGARLSFYDSLDADAKAIEPAVAVSGPAPPDWACFCRLATTPPDARYVSVRVEHTPTADDTACVAYDRLRLVAWEAQNAQAQTLSVPNHVELVRVTGAADATEVSVAYTLHQASVP